MRLVLMNSSSKYGNAYNSSTSTLVKLTYVCFFVAFVGWFYLTRSTVKTPIALIRILGNDLPPRHQLDQTLSNVKFLLRNEPRHTNCDKYWILNRIVDNSIENALIKLLEAHDERIIRIPFSAEEYSRIDFRWEDYPIPGYFWSNEFKSLKRGARRRAVEQIYHDKNLYVMNNVIRSHQTNGQNGGRNTAIMLGRKMNYKWTAAFDGNSFITRDSWARITDAIDQKENNSIKYISVPMHRLTRNEDALNLNLTINAKEEPQIIFKSDASQLYDGNMRYGRRSKVHKMIGFSNINIQLDLLWRLGIQKIPAHVLKENMNATDFQWEKHEWQLVSEANMFVEAGYILRLFSGSKNQEVSQFSAQLRAKSRTLGIQQFLDSVDIRIAQSSSKNNDFLLANVQDMLNIRLSLWNQGENHYLWKSFHRLKREATHISNVYRNVDALVEAPSLGGAVSGYLSTGVFDYCKYKKVHFETFNNVIRNISTLNMMWWMDGDIKWTSRSRYLLRHFILGIEFPHDPIHYQAPDLSCIDSETLDFPREIVQLDFASLLDSIKNLLKYSKMLKAYEISQVYKLASNMLEIFSKNPKFVSFGSQQSQLALNWHKTIIALCDFLGKESDFLKMLHLMKMRIPQLLNLYFTTNTIPDTCTSNHSLRECISGPRLSILKEISVFQWIIASKFHFDPENLLVPNILDSKSQFLASQVSLGTVIVDLLNKAYSLAALNCLDGIFIHEKYCKYFKNSVEISRMNFSKTSSPLRASAKFPPLTTLKSNFNMQGVVLGGVGAESVFNNIFIYAASDDYSETSQIAFDFALENSESLDNEIFNEEQLLDANITDFHLCLKEWISVYKFIQSMDTSIQFPFSTHTELTNVEGLPEFWMLAHTVK